MAFITFSRVLVLGGTRDWTKIVSHYWEWGLIRNHNWVEIVFKILMIFHQLHLSEIDLNCSRVKCSRWLFSCCSSWSLWPVDDYFQLFWRRKINIDCKVGQVDNDLISWQWYWQWHAAGTYIFVNQAWVMKNINILKLSLRSPPADPCLQAVKESEETLSSEWSSVKWAFTRLSYYQTSFSVRAMRAFKPSKDCVSVS